MKLIICSVAVLSLIALGCSSGSDGESSADEVAETLTGDQLIDEDPEFTDAIPDASSQSPEEWEVALAESWAKANPDNVEAIQNCVGSAIVEQVTIERLLELGVRIENIDEGMVSARFTDSENDQIQALTDECVNS